LKRNLLALIPLILVLGICLKVVGYRSHRVEMVSEDTVLGKLAFETNTRMCCSSVEFPCCTHESCCDAYEAEGLDQESEKAMPTELFELSGVAPRRVKQLRTNRVRAV